MTTPQTTVTVSTTSIAALVPVMITVTLAVGFGDVAMRESVVNGMVTGVQISKSLLESRNLMQAAFTSYSIDLMNNEFLDSFSHCSKLACST